MDTIIIMIAYGGLILFILFWSLPEIYKSFKPIIEPDEN
jgi:hypothetical protein